MYSISYDLKHPAGWIFFFFFSPEVKMEHQVNLENKNIAHCSKYGDVLCDVIS